MNNFVFYNPNPKRTSVGDCTIRAIAKVTGKSWDQIYWDLCAEGFEQCDMPSSNNVWGQYLLKNGFQKMIVPDRCPECYTVGQLTADLPAGEYVLCTGSHVIACIDHVLYDSWDSRGETPIYYWKKRRTTS